MIKANSFTISVGIFSAIVSSSVVAQSKFEGAYGQVGVGYQNVSPSFSTGGINATGLGLVPVNTNLNNLGSFIGTIGVGYMASISNNFLLGIGAEYSPFNSTTENYSYTIPRIGATLPGTYQQRGAYNIFLSPATPIGSDGLLYGKVGFTGTSVNTTEAAASITTNYTGYSLGLGYKQLISGGWYAFGEVNYASYGNQSNTFSGTGPAGRPFSFSFTSSLNTASGIVGLGYKF
jgi:hypothetical protein